VSRECSICGKKPITGNNVSHSHKKTKRRWLPNLQKIKIKLDGENKRVKVCTRCIKSGRVEKAV
jgi:large subunit ribosomal protein L28